MAWISQVGNIAGAIGALGSIFGGGGASRRAQKLANRATGQQMQLTQQQIDMIKGLMPFINQMQGADSSLVGPLAGNALKGLQFAQSYDPSKQTSDLTRSYDEAGAASLGRDLGTPIAQQAVKGFTAGTGDSDTGGMLASALAKRSVDRSAYVANLKAAEPGNLMNVLGSAGANAGSTFGAMDPAGAITGRYGGATGALGNAAGELGNIAGRQQGIASSYDPVGAIGSLSGIFQNLFGRKQPGTMPWQHVDSQPTSLSNLP